MKRINLKTIVGKNQALHYDVLFHRIWMRPTPEIDYALDGGPRKKMVKKLVFDDVSNIAISSRDNLVIAKCLSINVASQKDKQSCVVKFDDCGKKVRVAFTFDRMEVVSEKVKHFA